MLDDGDVFEAFVPVHWIEGTTAENDLPVHDKTVSDPNEAVNDPHEQENEQENEQVKAPSREQLILDLIHENPAITYHEAADALKVFYSTTRRSFQALREPRAIERIGSDRRGTWRILTPTQSLRK